MNNRSLFPGVVLILLGLIFLLPNFTPLRWHDLWPFFVLAPGVWLVFVFIQDKSKYGVLMPATILSVTGILFLYCNLTDWSSMGELWPFFIIAPGLGFLLMYQLGRKEPGLLVPGTVLIILGGFFLIGVHLAEYFWPILLIAVGVFLLLRGRRRDAASDPTPSNEPRPTP